VLLSLLDRGLGVISRRVDCRVLGGVLGGVPEGCEETWTAAPALEFRDGGVLKGVPFALAGDARRSEAEYSLLLPPPVDDDEAADARAIVLARDPQPHTLKASAQRPLSAL
jgi:hypothetical protein